jgi:hypothetical protein
VIVVGDAAERRLDAADDDRDVAVGLAGALGVDDDRAVGPLAGQPAGGIGVIRPHPSIGGVPVDHGVHVAGGDPEEQVGPPERLEGLGAGPVGLADDPDPEALGLQDAADDGHAEAGVVDVGVPVTTMMSQESQPSASISSADMGRKGAGVSRLAQKGLYEKMSRGAGRVNWSWAVLDTAYEYLTAGEVNPGFGIGRNDRLRSGSLH